MILKGQVAGFLHTPAKTHCQRIRLQEQHLQIKNEPPTSPLLHASLEACRINKGPRGLLPVVNHNSMGPAPCKQDYRRGSMQMQQFSTNVNDLDHDEIFCNPAHAPASPCPLNDSALYHRGDADENSNGDSIHHPWCDHAGA